MGAWEQPRPRPDEAGHQRPLLFLPVTLGRTESFSGSWCPCLRNSLEGPSSGAHVLGGALAVSGLLARAWVWTPKEGDAVYRRGCRSRKPGNVAGETDRAGFYWGGSQAAFRGVVGLPRRLFFSPDGILGQLTTFTCPKHCRAQGMVLPRVGMTVGVPPGCRRRVEREPPARILRGGWEVQGRPQYCSCLSSSPRCRWGRGCREKEGGPIGGGDEAEREGGGRLQASPCVFKTNPGYPAATRRSHQYSYLKGHLPILLPLSDHSSCREAGSLAGVCRGAGWGQRGPGLGCSSFSRRPFSFLQRKTRLPVVLLV